MASGSLRAALLLLLLGCGARAGEEEGPPSEVVDLARFPRHDAARFEEARQPELHVSPAGDDGAAGSAAAPLRTLRAALRRARAIGARRLVVRAGTYAEGEAEDDAALRLVQDDLVVTTLQDERALVRPTAETVRTGLVVAADRVAWRGISFEGFAACGVAIGATGRTLEQVCLADLEVRMPAGGDGVAVFPEGAEGAPVLRGLTLARVAVRGADLGFTVGAGPAADIQLVDVVVANRRGQDASGSDAIAVERGEHVLLWRVEASGAAGDGIDLKASRVAVVDAWVHDVGRNGLKLWRGGDVVNALVHDAGADAAVVLEAAAPDLRYRLAHVAVTHHLRGREGRAFAMTVGYDQPTTPLTLDLVNCWFAFNRGPPCLSKATRLVVRGCLFGPGPGEAVLVHGWDGSRSAEVRASERPEALGRAGQAADNLPFDAELRLAAADPRGRDEFRPGRGSPLSGAGLKGPGLPARDLARRPRGRRPAIGPLEPAR